MKATASPPPTRGVLQSHLTGDALATFDQAVGYARGYLEQAGTLPVFPRQDALDRLAELDEPLPARGMPAPSVIRLLHELATPAAVTTMGGRYFGFVHGGVLPSALAAKMLASAWDQNSALNALAPGVSRIEAITERWLNELFGLPDETSVGFVSGTSVSLLCGIVIARDELLRRTGWEVERDGLSGAPPLQVIAGEQAHAAVSKALRIAGLGAGQVCWIPADSQGRMRLDRLPDFTDRTLVITQAGHVNSGAFDPLEEITRRAGAAGSWVHVDGAFGMWAAAVPSLRHLTQGIERADSWSADGHKTLNTPYDCGMIGCRHPDAHRSSMQAAGSYLVRSDSRDGMSYTPEMGRRARAVEIWAALKNLGRHGVIQLVEQLCRNARILSEALECMGLMIDNEVVFNQVLVRAREPEQTQRLLDHVQRSGVLWCGGAEWGGHPVIRISVCSWVTDSADIHKVLETFRAGMQADPGV